MTQGDLSRLGEGDAEARLARQPAAHAACTFSNSPSPRPFSTRSETTTMRRTRGVKGRGALRRPRLSEDDVRFNRETNAIVDRGHVPQGRSGSLPPIAPVRASLAPMSTAPSPEALSAGRRSCRVCGLSRGRRGTTTPAVRRVRPQSTRTRSSCDPYRQPVGFPEADSGLHVRKLRALHGDG
jgi:hypothetical protein